MGTTAYGGKGSKGRAANGDRPVGAASCRRDHHTMASCQNPQEKVEPQEDEVQFGDKCLKYTIKNFVGAAFCPER